MTSCRSLIAAGAAGLLAIWSPPSSVAEDAVRAPVGLDDRSRPSVLERVYDATAEAEPARLPLFADGNVSRQPKDRGQRA